MGVDYIKMKNGILEHIGLCDTYFKLLLEKDKKVLVALINGICNLNIKEEEVINMPTESIEGIGVKTTFYDIRIKTQNININIESEDHKKGNKEYYDNRKFLYLSRLHSQSYLKGERYNEIKQSIVIFLYNFDIGGNDLIEDTRMYNIQRKEFYTQLQVYDVNLAKLDKSSKIELERLLSLLTSRDISKYLNDKDPLIGGAAKMIDGFDKDEILRIKARHQEEAEMEYYGLLAGAKIEGKEEGIKLGKEEGLKIGKEETKIEIATKLLKLGVDVETISKASGLTIEEIKKLA